jgi:hypothetical protein
MNDIFIRVNDRPLTLRRRAYLARCFLWLAWCQMVGRTAQLNLLDCDNTNPKE